MHSVFVHFIHLLKMKHGIEVSSRSRNKSGLTRLSFVSISHLISKVCTKFLKLASLEVGVDWLCSFFKNFFVMLAIEGMYQY